MMTSGKYPALAAAVLPLLTQCDTTRRDLEAVAQQNAEISKEQGDGYYVGRRYYIPNTRFWGYIRPPRTPWVRANLVIMDESMLLAPDRGPETGDAAVYGKDNNFEYKIYGKYTDRQAYDPNSNQRLDVFLLTGYRLVNSRPGWLFKPSERYSTKEVSLRPAIVPKPLPEH
ncbi:MAG: hypothetical protein LUG84_03930 [Akkermansiaceae bacterium]|nr:hypothetical protein [Akkermansiaceae bacterium]MCD8071538.1 hypothetical protein [Akkermansiaceae bacterium]